MAAGENTTIVRKGHILLLVDLRRKEGGVIAATPPISKGIKELEA